LSLTRQHDLSPAGTDRTQQLCAVKYGTLHRYI
jgi:hypothetical protein